MASSGVLPVLQIVNRTEKGDRLPLITALAPNRGNRVLDVKVMRRLNRDQQLIEGCDALVSPLTGSQWGQIAGRCVS